MSAVQSILWYNVSAVQSILWYNVSAVQSILWYNVSAVQSILWYNVSAVQSILAVSSHQLEGRTLHVQEYFECLGLTPPDHDTTSPDGWIPDSVTVTGLKANVLTYLLISPLSHERVDKEMTAVAAVVEWGTCDDASTSVELRCSLTHKTEGECRLAKTWSQTATTTFLQLMDTLQEEMSCELMCLQVWV